MLICVCDSVDLVIAEPELPGISGAQLAETLSRALPSVPVMLLPERDAAESEPLLSQVGAALETAPCRRPAAAAVAERPVTRTA
jgi:hypothetical protein